MTKRFGIDLGRPTPENERKPRPVMSFVHAIPLAVVVALALIPVALHLFARQRLQTVELPTFRFLVESYVRQRRRTRLHEFVVAALRVLCVLGLVAIVARPLADRGNRILPAGDGRDVILLIDCSASMTARADGRSALDRAKAAAEARVTPDDRVTLVRVTGRPEVILHGSRTIAAELRSRIDRLETAASNANLRAAVASAFDGRRLTNPVLYFFTDMQASTFQELDASVLPPDTPVVVVDVGTRTPRGNVAVVGNSPDRHRAVVGLPVPLTTRLVNYSSESAEGTFTFTVNEREVERHSMKLGPNETVVRLLSPYVPQGPGPVRAKFEFAASTGIDAFPDDDSYSFVLPVEPKGKVLLVNGGPDADPFQDELLYLRAALQPGREAVSAFEVKEELEGAWAGLDEARLKAKLDEYAVVILADAGNLHRVTSYAYPALRAFVQDGGGLVLFPGDHVEPATYSLSFFRGPPPVKDFLLPVQLGPAEGDPERPNSFRRLVRIDFDHPVFRPFRADGRYFDRVVVKRRWSLAIQPGKAVSVLAEYPDRSPAVVEGRYGDGRVVLFTFPANGRWTTLPVNGAEFVPLVLQTTNHVRRRDELEAPGVVMAGERATVAVAPGWAPVTGTVEAPGGGGADLVFERFGGRLEAAYDATDDRGEYKVRIRSSGGGSQSSELRFAVNVHPTESDPTRLSEGRLRELLPMAAVSIEDRSAESERAAVPETDRELWRYVIYCLFAAIACEWLLATLGGPARPSDPR